MKRTLPFFIAPLRSSIKQILLVSFLCAFFSFKTTALNYYWVGGTGNWSNLNHWATTSGGSTFHIQIPTALDNVFFDANSFSAPGQTVTLDPLTVLVNNMTWTGATNTPTLTGSLSTLLKVYGSVTFISGMNMNFSGDVDFESTVSGNSITMGGKSFDRNVSFNGIGGSWTLQDNFAAGYRISLNNGILTTNDKTVNAYEFSSAVAASRTLNMGASVFNISGTSSCWNISGGGMSLNCGTSVINFTSGGAVFSGGGHVYNDLNFTSAATGATGTVADNNFIHDIVFWGKGYLTNSISLHNVTFNADGEFQGNNVFNDLTLSPGRNYVFYSGKNQTINGAFNANGTCASYIFIHTESPTLQTTISHPGGPVTTSFLILKDMIASGPSNFTANNSVDFGNNTNWLINMSLSKDYYWIGNAGNWNDGSHWSLTSGGPASGCGPSPLDNAVFDANSFSIAGQAVTLNVPTAYCKDMRWTGVTNNPSLAGPTTSLLKIHGSITLAAGMNLTFGGDVSFESNFPSETITSAGKTFKRNIVFNSEFGTWTLQDALTVVNRISLNAGTFTSNNQTVSAYEFFATTTPTKVLNMGSSVFNISGNFTCWSMGGIHLTVNCGTSVINLSGLNADFRGLNQNFYDINFTNNSPSASTTVYSYSSFHDAFFAGNTLLYYGSIYHNATFNADAVFERGNTFNNLTFSQGRSYTLFPGFTQTINGTFNANGTCSGALIDIHSGTPGLQTTISHPPGAVTTSYLMLKDIAATGGAIFTANSSIDLGNNSGWNINSGIGRDLYWINNTGNWSDGNHWSLTSGGPPLGCTPTLLDNVFFDVNSFSLPAQVVTVDVTTAYCRNMTWTGSTGTPSFAGAFTNVLKIYGSLTFISSMNLNFLGDVSFESTTPSKTIITGGRSFRRGVIFNGIGGEWTLLDPFASIGRITLNNGTLNTNDQMINALEFYSISPNARTLNMGASVFNITGTIACWNIFSAAMTLNCGTSVINCSGLTPQFFGGSKTYHDIIFTNGAVAAYATLIDNNIIHDVVFAAKAYINQSNTVHDMIIYGDAEIKDNNSYHNLTFSANHTYILSIGSTQTISNRWMIQGSCTSYILLQSSVAGSFATVTMPAGQVLGYNIHMKDIHATGGANFIAYNSVDLGGNTGWTFSALPSLTSPGPISGPSPVCAGATGVAYHISPVPGAIYYQWTVPAGATITSGQGDTLIVVDFNGASSGNISVLSFNGCSYSANSSVFPVAIAVNLSPAVTIAANPAGSICVGVPVTFTASTTNTGSSTITYDFKLNGASVQTGNSNVYTTTTLANGDNVSCDISITGGGTCFLATTASSNIISISVGAPSTTPTVSLAANPVGPVCLGSTVTFTATASTNGTGSINYDFKVNGVSVQSSTSNIYTVASLANGDNVSCNISVTGGTCYLSTTATSNSILMSMSSVSTPSVSITASPGFPNCVGANMTFTATTSNTGGGSVSYNFKVNAASVQSGPSNVYSTSTLSSGNIVSCDITVAGGSCLTSNTASSNTIPVALLPVSTASITITVSSTTVCIGVPTTFTAVPINGGAAAAYQWKINGVNAGTNSTTFISSTLNNGDVVTCTMTSFVPCVTNPVSVSNSISMNVISSPTPVVTITASNNNICAKAPVTFTAIPLNTGSTPSFQWQLNGINVGTNSVTYFNNSLANADKINCIMNTVTACAAPFVSSNTITMTVNPKPVISFSPSNPTIIIGDAVQLNASASGNITSYLWTPSTGLSNDAIHNPIARPLNTITYHLHVSGGVNCFADSNITVKVLDGIYIPNAFMPGRVNNIFRIPPLTAIKDLQYFQVYNRYGNLIFYTNDINKGWDGTWKGTQCDPGTYTYIIKARNHNGEVLLKGTVNLIR